MLPVGTRPPDSHGFVPRTPRLCTGPGERGGKALSVLCEHPRVGGGVSDMSEVGHRPLTDYPGISICQACLKAAIVLESGE